MVGDVVNLRAATRRDLGFLVELRNDPESVRFSKRGTLRAEAIARDYLERTDKRAFVADRDGERLGYAVFELLGGAVAEISVALALPCRGSGLARPLIEAASALALRELGVAVIRAEIDPANTASRRAFAGAGYCRVRAAGPAERLERYELKDASPRSGVAPDPTRGPARRPPGPPPQGL